MDKSNDKNTQPFDPAFIAKVALGHADDLEETSVEILKDVRWSADDDYVRDKQDRQRVADAEAREEAREGTHDGVRKGKGVKVKSNRVLAEQFRMKWVVDGDGSVFLDVPIPDKVAEKYRKGGVLQCENEVLAQMILWAADGDPKVMSEILNDRSVFRKKILEDESGMIVGTLLSRALVLGLRGESRRDPLDWLKLARQIIHDIKELNVEKRISREGDKHVHIYEPGSIQLTPKVRQLLELGEACEEVGEGVTGRETGDTG